MRRTSLPRGRADREGARRRSAAVVRRPALRDRARASRCSSASRTKPTEPMPLWVRMGMHWGCPRRAWRRHRRPRREPRGAHRRSRGHRVRCCAPKRRQKRSVVLDGIEYEPLGPVFVRGFADRRAARACGRHRLDSLLWCAAQPACFATASRLGEGAVRIEVAAAQPAGAGRVHAVAGRRRARTRAARRSGRFSSTTSSGDMPSRCFTRLRNELPCAATSTVAPVRRSGTIVVVPPRQHAFEHVLQALGRAAARRGGSAA